MCLYPKGNLKKAKHDIVCYKVMYRTTDNTFHSKFWNTYDSWYIGEFKKAKFSYYSVNSPDVFGGINGGYIHSYKACYDAKTSCDEDELCVVKCIIPKKTHYYEGLHSSGKYGYASKKLKIIEVIKYDKHYIKNKVKYIAK